MTDPLRPMAHPALHHVQVRVEAQREQFDALTPEEQAEAVRLGAPIYEGWRNSTTVVFRHPSEESAQAAARVNSERYGHVVSVERDDKGWLCAIDMSAAIAHQGEATPSETIDPVKRVTRGEEGPRP